MSEINYTISSSDPKDYSIIKQSLVAPSTELTEFLVTGLTTMCSFVLLDSTDYIEFEIYNETNITPNKYRVYWTRSTTNLTYHKFCDIFNSLISGNPDTETHRQLKTSMDIESNELNIFTIRSLFRFAITDMTYRMRMITGFFDASFSKRPHYQITGSRRINATIDTNDFIEIDFGHDKYTYRVTEQITIDRTDQNTYLEFMRNLIKNKDIQISLYNNYTVLQYSQEFQILSISNNLKNITGLDITTSTQIFNYDTESYLVCVSTARNPRPKPNPRDAWRFPGPSEYISFGFDNDHDYTQLPLTIKRFHLLKVHMIYLDSVPIILDMLREAVTIPGIRFTLNDNNRIMISLVGKQFTIVEISPLLSELTGFVAGQYADEIFAIRSPSKGYFNMTPILYLISNIGTVCNCYKGNENVKRRILMRINNNYIQDYPIECTNFEFSSIIPSNALSDVTFQLVDANFQPIQLKAPMYLRAVAMPVQDKILKYISEFKHTDS